MPKLLTPFSVVAPGSYGLNTKLAGLEIGPQWCLTSRNCALSDQGTVSARKGWSPFAGVSQLSGEPDPRTIHEYIDNGNSSRIIWSAGNKIYEGTSSVSAVTGAVSPTADNWKFVNFNGKVVGVQAGHNPIVKSDGGDFAEIAFDASPTDPIEALSAWGRVWYVEGDAQTIKYSDLLQEDTINGGSSGVINMYTVWSNGTDEIVGIQEFNNYLVIFGRKQVVLYAGGEDPNNSLRIVDIINNTGCIARDSIQNIGNDILFLGEEGIISLARNIQAGGDVRSLPLANLADNVSDFLSQFSLSEPSQNIKSCYKADDGFYLITFPTSKITFYLNIRYQTPDKKARIFTWYDINPTALAVDRQDNVYIGKPGYLARYIDYSDNGEPYNMQFKTGWISGEGEVGTSNKIFKQAVITIKGGYGSRITLDWGFDFLPTSYDSENNAVEILVDPSEYNVGEYSTAEYSRINPVSQVLYRMSGSGKSVQFGIETEITGAELNIQKADLYLKGGKIARRSRR
jgi:hypothetical protein